MALLGRTCTVLIVILAIILGYIGNTLFSLGAFRSITADQERGNNNCEILTKKNPKLRGCEDVAEFEDGTIILSCVDRDILFKETFSSKPMTQVMEENAYSHPGYLFRMKSISSPIDNNKEFVELKLLNRQSPDFHPHGIGLITDKTNTRWIYVINHRRDGDFVEIYELNKDGTTATLSDEVHSPLFVFINDLKPILLDSKTKPNRIGFYVANSFGFPLKTKVNSMEMALGLPFSDLVFCEPDVTSYKDRYDDKNVFKPQWKCKVVDKNLAFGNGVDISVDGKEVYAVESMGPSMRVYDRNERDNTLTWKMDVKLSTVGDNIHLDRDTGDLYIGCHPNVLQLLQHQMNSSVVAPSQVLKWNKKEGVTEIFLTNGNNENHVSASSVGVYNRKAKSLLIGTVNDGTMRCKL